MGDFSKSSNSNKFTKLANSGGYFGVPDACRHRNASSQSLQRVGPGKTQRIRIPGLVNGNRFEENASPGRLLDPEDRCGDCHRASGTYRCECLPLPWEVGIPILVQSTEHHHQDNKGLEDSLHRQHGSRHSCRRHCRSPRRSAGSNQRGSKPTSVWTAT